MPNDVRLQEGHPVDENLRPIKVGGKSTAIETAQHGNGARVNGDLEVTGDIYGDTKLSSKFNISGDFKIKLTGTVTALEGSATIEGSDTLFTTELAVGDAIKILQETFIVSSITDIDTLVLDSAYVGSNASGLTAYTDDNLLIVQNGDSVDKIKINKSGNIVSTDLTIDDSGDITLDSATGKFIAKNNATEFSADNSAYAGMILGYTDIGLDEAHTSLSLTTSFVVPTDEFSVSFTAPPSGNVQLESQVFYTTGSSGAGDLFLGLSTANATSGYSALEPHHEKWVQGQGGRNQIETVKLSWTLTGLTPNSDYEYWLGVKSDTTSGTPAILWGGGTSGRYPDFIFKAIALPETITT